MKLRILMAALCLGILVGIVLFTQPSVRTLTGTAIADCSVENQPCSCDAEHCVCGNMTVPAEYCSNKV